MLNWMKNNPLLKKFEKKFINFNSYTLKATKIKSDEELKDFCLNCLHSIAKQNNKDIKSVSLEDIYRALHKVRQKTPDLLRQVTWSQMEKGFKTAKTVGDGSSLFISIASLNPLPLMFWPLKKFFGKKIKYVMTVYLVSFMAKEVYGGNTVTNKKQGLGQRFKKLKDSQLDKLEQALANRKKDKTDKMQG